MNKELLRNVLKGEARDSGKHSAVLIAESVGWIPDGIEPTRVHLQGEVLNVTLGCVDNHPAVMFLQTDGQVTNSAVDQAALYAYHSNIEWGVLFGRDEATIFNSLWVRNNQWFRFSELHFSPDQIESTIALIQTLSPEFLLSGELNRIATLKTEPDVVLMPVDDALVQRLDYWRNEVVRHSRAIDDIDHLLHLVFAQFFVLRAIEDRSLAPKIPALLSAREGYDGLRREQLDEILAQAKVEIQSDLFSQNSIASIPDFIVSGIIADLYFPKHLPTRTAKYNFAWVKSDVLGMAYQKYLSSVMEPRPLTDVQLSLWHQPLREVERTSAQRSRGIYYSPDYLVQYLTNRSLNEFGVNKDGDIHIPTIADFSCGSGSFLTVAADHLISRLRRLNKDKNWGREIIENRKIIGVDVDARAVTLARLSLWLRLTEEPDALPLPKLDESIIQSNALDPGTFEVLPNEYDLILGNPPFLANNSFPKGLDLAEIYETAHGRFDYSYLFVELAVKKLRRGGVLALIVPNRLFANKDAGRVRSLITKELTLRSVLDFGSNEVFAGVKAYIGAIIATRPIHPDDPKGEIRALKVTDPKASHMGIRIFMADQSTGSYEGTNVKAFNTKHPFGEHAWMMLSERDVGLHFRIEEDSFSLAELAVTYQGIKTGANDIFIVETAQGVWIDGYSAQIVNGLGESFPIETSLLRPAVYGSQIQRYSLVNSNKFLIYPYRGGRILSEETLNKEYPLTYAYLRRYKSILENRSSMRSIPNWFGLAWPRNEDWLSMPKLMTRDLATRTSFALDELGSYYLIGGTAVVPNDPTLLHSLIGYLNSSVADWYLKLRTPSFRSGFQKYEGQHISEIPIPKIVLSDGKVSAYIEEYSRRILTLNSNGSVAEASNLEDEVNSLIANCVGIDPRELR